MNADSLYNNFCEAINEKYMYIYPHDLFKDRIDMMVKLATKYDMPIIIDNSKEAYIYHDIAKNKYNKGINIISVTDDLFDFRDFYNKGNFLINLSNTDNKEMCAYLYIYKRMNFVGFV